MSTFDAASLLPGLIDHIEVGVFIIDRNYNIVLWNRFMTTHSGIAGADLVGKPLFEAFPDLPRKWLEKKLQSVLILKNFAFTSWEQRPWLFPFTHNRPITGGIDFMQQNCIFMPLTNPESGDVDFISITISDVTDTAIYQRQLTDAMVKLEQSNMTDALTAIYNRRYFQQRINAEVSRAERHGPPLSLIIYDLDHFKLVNDNYGHLAGDEVLRETAARVKTLVRTMDVFGRYGGEEFAIVLPDTDLNGAKVLAERIRATIESAPVQYNERDIPVTGSVGVAQYDGSLNTAEKLIAAADEAMYEAKHNGRNQVRCFPPKPAHT